MLIFLLADPPFNANVKVSNWDISTGKDQTEVTMAKSPNYLVASWINMDNPSYYTVNQLAVSTDNGYTWTQVTQYTTSNPSCWVGDPSLASDPNDPNKFYWVGMVWCQSGMNVYGEVYFCTNTGTPDNSANWSCSILPPNDNWSHFKDKPWIIARDNAGNTELLVVFTADGYSSTSFGTYEMLAVKSTDGGATWQPPVRIDPGYTSTVAYTYYDGSTVHLSKNCIGCYGGYDVVIEYHNSSDFGGTWNYVVGVIGSVPSGGSATCTNFNRPVKITSSIVGVGSKVAIAGISDESGSGGSDCSLIIAFSTDGGSSWSGVGDTTSQYILPVLATDGVNSIYAMVQVRSGTSAPWTTVMFSSTDWGTTWSTVRVSDHDYTMNEDPPGHDYNSLLFDAGHLFAIWGNDYYNEDAGAIYFATTATATNYAELPAVDNGRVKIYRGGVDIPEKANVYNSSGRLIFANVKGRVQLEPGVYFIRRGSEIRKVVVR